MKLSAWHSWSPTSLCVFVLLGLFSFLLSPKRHLCKVPPLSQPRRERGSTQRAWNSSSLEGKESLFTACDWCIQRMPLALFSLLSQLSDLQKGQEALSLRCLQHHLKFWDWCATHWRAGLGCPKGMKPPRMLNVTRVSPCVLLLFSFPSPGQGEPFQNLLHFMEANAKYNITHPCSGQLFHGVLCAPKVTSVSS